MIPSSLKIKSEHLALGVIAAFLTASAFIIGDYNINVDSPKNFSEGLLNLHFLLTGKVLSSDILYQTHGALMFMAADAFFQIFHVRLNWLDPILAHHMVLPLAEAWFLWAFFTFIRRHWSGHIGVIAILLFASYPGFIGQAFNNLKDIGLLIFFSMTIMASADYFDERTRRNFYAFFIFLGLAASVKVLALLTLPILILWYGVIPKPEHSQGFNPRLPHFCFGILITLNLVAIFYFPAFWGIENKIDFIKLWAADINRLSFQHTSWGMRTFRAVFQQTPLPMLFAAAIGVVYCFKNFARDRRKALIAIWVLTPLLLGCFPKINFYGGMRHYLMFLPPFAVCASLGIELLAKELSFRFPHHLSKFFYLLGIFVFLVNFNALRIMHPYESLFFNHLAGGLQEAQLRRVPYTSWDAWLNCYKEAAAWLEKNALPNTWVITNYSTPVGRPPWEKPLLRYILNRPDLRVMRRYPHSWNQPIPHKSYILFVPFIHYKEYDDYKNLLEGSPDITPVYRVLRQGGEIFAIYYKS